MTHDAIDGCRTHGHAATHDPATGPTRDTTNGHAARYARKSARADDCATPAVEFDGERWQLRSHDAVRQVLRATTSTTQAGFNAEMVTGSDRLRQRPVLFQDGEPHRRQRKAIARYFAPVTVTANYRDIMATRADELVAEMVSAGRADLAKVTMRYSVSIAAQVVGLTNSDPNAMARRLDAFFAMPPAAPSDSAGRFGRIVDYVRSLRSVPPMLSFRRHDVMPAIEARRAQPRQDVISHLIEQGYSEDEILIECVTYGAAGMVTTREFISMATWHLLDDQAARERYLAGDEAHRLRILEEILRLEPIVSHLLRRAVEPITITMQPGTGAQETYTIPAGALIDLHIRMANADERAVGADPLALCPQRELAKGVRPEAMSFGDGPHRCPGNVIAMQESDVFLQRLLRLPVRLASQPRLEWEELIKAYAVRDIILQIDAAAPA